MLWALASNFPIGLASSISHLGNSGKSQRDLQLTIVKGDRGVTQKVDNLEVIGPLNSIFLFFRVDWKIEPESFVKHLMFKHTHWWAPGFISLSARESISEGSTSASAWFLITNFKVAHFSLKHRVMPVIFASWKTRMPMNVANATETEVVQAYSTRSWFPLKSLTQ